MTGLLLSPGMASAARPTKAQLQNYPADFSGSFTATGPTLCASGTWDDGTGALVLTCSNGTDSIAFIDLNNAPHGKMGIIWGVISGSGTGALTGVTGQLTVTRESGTTGVLSGSLS
jgi:hypothetical protein